MLNLTVVHSVDLYCRVHVHVHLTFHKVWSNYWCMIIDNSEFLFKGKKKLWRLLGTLYSNWQKVELYSEEYSSILDPPPPISLSKKEEGLARWTVHQHRNIHNCSLYSHTCHKFISRPYSELLYLGNKLSSAKYWTIKNNNHKVVAKKGCGQTYLHKYTHIFLPIFLWS